MQSGKQEDKLAAELIEETIQTGATELSLWGFGLTTVPAEIGKLINLTSLDLSNNQLTSLPKEIGLLTNLVELNLAENRLSTLPVEIGNLTQLPLLNLDYNQLSQLPSDFFNLTNLTSLSLRQNRLKTLSPKIGKLVNLVTLDLSGNRLMALPSEIGQLSNLSFLKLWDNVLHSLPAEIKELTKLPSLDLHDNSLIEIPREIEELVTLSFLDLAENSLTTLPPEVGKLINLIGLKISANNLVSLPSELGKLGKLISLDISRNKLHALPPEISRLMQLEELDLRDNNLDIPQEIQGKVNEPQKILNYLAHLVAGKRQSADETKILVVGQGSVGKSSVVRRILYNKFDIGEHKTEGIDILKHQFYAKNRTFSINIWDFGGQEILHATHQFFLTKRSLYLLVLDARLTQEENRVEYWLKIIQSFGGDSPVIIAGNKTDQHPLDIDRTGLQRKYSNIVDIIETSAKTGKGMDKLKHQIALQVGTLPHVRELLPETWLIVKAEIEKLGKNKNFITQEEYFSICNENKVNDQTSQQTLLGFLHDLGIILHFQEDPRLEALGILNPHWVTNGVYKILNSHELFQNKGVLPLSLLNQILDSPEYPKDKQLFIVDMMKRFELCHDIDQDKTFLIPDLLPKDEPFLGEKEWEGALPFQIHYNILPTSIITRFIVRMNSYIHKTVWRSGVVLKNIGNLALIKADIEDRKISILISGDKTTRRDFLAMIRMEFDIIHKSLAKIEAVEKIPLPAYPDATPIDHKLLLQLEKSGISTHHVQSGNKLIEANVRALLSGIEPEPMFGIRGATLNIQGNVTDTVIAIGDNNTISAKNIFKSLYRSINESFYENEDKEDIIAEVNDIEDEVLKGDQADESFLARRLRNLRKMAPDIAEIMLAALTKPTAAVSIVIQKIAKKIKGETK